MIHACRKCPRLVSWWEEVAAVKRKAYHNEEYWGNPVSGFGDPDARVMALGLAPGAHGSNRTGRMFTGDASGDFLYPALYKAGFASQPKAVSRDDGMALYDLYITAICLCVPPDNKPTQQEIGTCQPYHEAALSLLHNLQGVVVFGKMAYDQVLRIFRHHGWQGKAPQFGHGVWFEPGEGFPWILTSYHPSRQNTQTGKLTVEMFDRIWATVKDKLH